VARLTRACRYDLLLEAVAQLGDSGRHIEICLIGTGPEEADLRRQAERLGVDLVLPGAVYDERLLGEQIFAADLTVCPGKIGLSAIHSLSYGTPVVTHGDLDSQMPEVEAIAPGVNGTLFERGDTAALAAAIRSWMIEPTEREAVRDRCIEVVEERYNPIKQAELIDATVSAVCAR
jgi:glycosyltransferase involved in cell wall biosynthesis